MARAFIKFFGSLRLAVVLLSLGLILVFWGTLAQVNLGLYRAQNEFFRSFFVYWHPAGSGLKFPIFPAGYLLGGLLLINLFVAHLRYYQPTKRKIGIAMIHIGIVLLLLGQLLTDMLSTESAMHLRVGEVKNYSEEDRRSELAVVDVSGAQSDRVVAIPDSLLKPRQEIRTTDLPFTIRVESYFPNSALSRDADPAYQRSPATQGAGVGFFMREEPRVTSMDFQDTATGIVELLTPQGSLGKWMVSEFLNPQALTLAGRTYEIVLRSRRHYEPFSLKLLSFNHAIYRGTDTPKDFSSMVRLQRPDTREAREVRIYMNNPLRYNGETFYQQSFDKDDQGSILQVVRNPGWLTPYLSCILVGLGMAVQFSTHLFGFIKKRMSA